MKVCHNHKGVIVGVAKDQVAIGAGVFVVLFQALQRDSNLDILLLMGVFNLLCSGLLPSFVLPTDSDSDNSALQQQPDPLTKHHIYLIYFSIILCGIFVVGQSLMSLFEEEYEGIDTSNEELHGVEYGTFSIVMLAWLGPLVATLFLKRAPRPLSLPTTTTTTTSGNNSLINNKNEADGCYYDGDKKDIKVSYNLLGVLSTPAGWLLIWTLVMLAGAGVVVTQNLGSMVQALELNEHSVTPAALALFAVGNACSRVTCGAMADYFPVRPRFLLLAATATTVAHALLAVAQTEGLFLLAVMLAGIAFGMYHPVVILLVGDLFGPKHLGSNFLFFEGMSLAGGSLLLNKFISETVYESYAGSNEDTCIGEACFGVTHWITCGLCLTTIFSCTLLLLTQQSQQAYSSPTACTTATTAR